MAIDFKRQQISFPPTTGHVQTVDITFVFDSTIRKAEAALNGFRVGFKSGDRPFNAIRIDTAVVGITANTVQVRVEFGLRDASGVFDDAYEGFVDVLVIVDRA